MTYNIMMTLVGFTFMGLFALVFALLVKNLADEHKKDRAIKSGEFGAKTTEKIVSKE